MRQEPHEIEVVRAAARYPASMPEERDNAVTNRDRVAAKMSAAQIAEAQRLAREWKPK